MTQKSKVKVQGQGQADSQLFAPLRGEQSSSFGVKGRLDNFGGLQSPEPPAFSVAETNVRRMKISEIKRELGSYGVIEINELVQALVKVRRRKEEICASFGHAETKASRTGAFKGK